jgi:hypothetical protein
MDKRGVDMDITKLQKVSDDLYVEEYKDKNGRKSQFWYERGFKTLQLNLFDARVVFSSDIELKEMQLDFRQLFRMGQQGEDTRKDNIGCSVTITAKCGEFENGDSVTVLNNDKPLTIIRASGLTIDRLSQWDEVLHRVRSEGNKLWMGRTLINTYEEAQKGFGPADELHLHFHMPPKQFDHIVSAIAGGEPDCVALSAMVKISAFRMEADRALSEPWHPKQIGIERSTPVILRRLTASKMIGQSAENRLAQLSKEEPRKGGKPESANEIWLPRLFWLGLAILAAVLLRL